MMEFKEFLDRTVGCKRRDTITNSIADSLKKEDISNIVLDELKEKEITKVLLEDSNNSYQNIMVVLSSVCSAIALFISALLHAFTGTIVFKFKLFFTSSLDFINSAFYATRLSICV